MGGAFSGSAVDAEGAGTESAGVASPSSGAALAAGSGLAGGALAGGALGGAALGPDAGIDDGTAELRADPALGTALFAGGVRPNQTSNSRRSFSRSGVTRT